MLNPSDQRFRNAEAQRPMKTFSLATGMAILLACTGNAVAAVIIQDFFGSTNDAGINGAPTRHDAAGNTVFMGQGDKGPTLIGIDGIRAQLPDTSAEVWSAPGGQHAATWFFASSSADPFEPAVPGDTFALVAGADAGTGGHLAALLPFSPPASAYKVSADMIPEGGDLRDWVAIGFTSSQGTLTNNFETFGQAWLMLKMNATGLGATTWELHTNGMTGPSVTGSTTFTGTYMRLALSYDPVAHLVSGSINGVLTPSISYTAIGITGVGMEAVEHISFGIADDFAVETGTIPSPGDFNRNDRVDVADVQAMMTALSDLSGYQSAKSLTDQQLAAIGDLDGDGKVTNIDLQNLIGVLANGAVGGPLAAVPEPASWSLFIIGFVSSAARCWIVKTNRPRRNSQACNYRLG